MRERTGLAYLRDRHLRNIALLRANGRCMLCKEQGFAMPGGGFYLETHHIVPLSEGGPDDSTNLVALCANHHREAHFGRSRLPMRQRLLALAAAPHPSPGGGSDR